MMLRSLGVPARYVTGFLARDPDSKGFLVRGTDGHAWVEVYVEGLGWVAFDPTAPAAPGAGMARPSQSREPGIRPEMQSGDANRLGNVAGLYGRKDFGKAVGSPGRRARDGERGGATEGLGGTFGRDPGAGGPEAVPAVRAPSTTRPEPKSPIAGSGKRPKAARRANRPLRGPDGRPPGSRALSVRRAAIRPLPGRTSARLLRPRAADLGRRRAAGAARARSGEGDRRGGSRPGFGKRATAAPDRRRSGARGGGSWRCS